MDKRQTAHDTTKYVCMYVDQVHDMLSGGSPTDKAPIGS